PGELDVLDVAVPPRPPRNVGPRPPDRVERDRRLDAVLAGPHPVTPIYAQIIFAQTISVRRPCQEGRTVAEAMLEALRAGRVEQLQELVCGELDRLVAPLGCAVVAGDDAGPVDAAEVAVDERVACLRPVVRAVGEPEVPGGVLVPRVRRQVV